MTASTHSKYRSTSSDTFNNPLYIGGQSPSAIKGASLAFNATPVNPKPITNTYTGINGARAAAAFAGGRRHKLVENVSSQDGLEKIGGSSKRPPVSLDKRLREDAGKEESKSLPSQPFSREQSPSQIAAALATSRSSPIQESAIAVMPMKYTSRRPSPLRIKEDGPSNGTAEDTKMPSTNALVALFESNSPHKPLNRNLRDITGPSPTIVSPTPVRPLTAKLSSPEGYSGISNRQRAVPHLSIPDQQHGGSFTAAAIAAARSASPAKTYQSQLGSRHADHGLKPLPAHRQQDSPTELRPYTSRATTSLRDSSQITTPTSTLPDIGPLTAPLPSFTRTTRSASANATQRKFSSSHTTVPDRPFPPPRLPSKTSIQSLPDTLKPNASELAISSLANAIVASSLASSRAPSPSKIPPIPPQRRHFKASLFRHPDPSSPIRTPSPAKPVMRTTMRLHRSSDDESPKRQSHLIKKAPNKHHEGDRARWRDSITEIERKRYEGVWAANKGVLIPTSEDQTCVLNLVVRDIWSRSRLSTEVLEEIWQLVDRRVIGTLEREEFVVGMWLVDQRLKGRKLPIKVGESVWSSVRRLSGIKIPRQRRR